MFFGIMECTDESLEHLLSDLVAQFVVLRIYWSGELILQVSESIYK